jgi:hypothetical protein
MKGKEGGGAVRGRSRRIGSMGLGLGLGGSAHFNTLFVSRFRQKLARESSKKKISSVGLYPRDENSGVGWRMWLTSPSVT